MVWIWYSSWNVLQLHIFILSAFWLMLLDYLQVHWIIWDPHYCWGKDGREGCRMRKAATFISTSTRWSTEKIEGDSWQEVSRYKWAVWHKLRSCLSGWTGFFLYKKTFNRVRMFLFRGIGILKSTLFLHLVVHEGIQVIIYKRYCTKFKSYGSWWM